MKKILLFVCLFNCSPLLWAQELLSPNAELQLKFSLVDNGIPTYQLFYKGKEVIKPSKLGLFLKNDSLSLVDQFSVQQVEPSQFDETWQPVLGEV